MDKTKKTGVILLNLGGPDSLDSVRPFLYNLFSDREIIKLGPSFFQKPIARLISILRSKKSKTMYSLIGGASPILEITGRQAVVLERFLNDQSENGGYEFKVFTGMRYWRPFIEDTVQLIKDSSITRCVALGLYPHYSKATTGSSFRELKRVLTHYEIDCRYIKSWPEEPAYIESLKERIESALLEFGGDCDQIIFSAHSLPVEFIESGDPYVDEILMTINCVKSMLPESLKFHLSYQSRSGPVKWLEPPTEEIINKLANRGVKKALVVPISFVSDHIETLYEIDILYKDLAMKQGLELKRTESLNDHPLFIKALKDIVMKAL